MANLKLGILGATRGLNFALSARNCGLPLELTAVCDIYQPLLDKVKARLPELGMKPDYFTDFQEMLQKADIDAVAIANNANDHAPFAIAALNAGKHVLSEVLPVQTPAQAVALTEAVERSGKVYFYAENYPFFAGNFEAARLYREGAIGEIIHAECDFINDCTLRWHLLTRGQRDHWRNYVPSTFYCTHSIAPLLFAIRDRAVRVTGFEVPNQEFLRSRGSRNGIAAMEIMQLANGVPLKSTHGNLRRSWESRLVLEGTEGAIVASTSNRDKVILYKDDGNCYNPFPGKAMPIRNTEGFSEAVRRDEVATLLAVFIGLINGDPVYQPYNIDVYQALDMAMPGLMAYRSILQGNVPVELPDFRNPAVREQYRHDNRCTDPRIASGDDLLPSHSRGNITVPDEVYAHQEELLREAMENNFKLGNN